MYDSNFVDRGEGYIPHFGERYFRCARCNGSEFKSFPQTIPTEGTWTFEYVCAACGCVMGLTVIRDAH